MTFAVMAAAGCGSTSAQRSAHVSTTATAPSGATRTQFLLAADRICRGLHSRQEPLNVRAQALTQDTPAARRALAALLRQSVTFGHAADAELRGLSRPPGEAAAIGRLLSGYQHEAAEVTAYAESLTKLEPEKQRFAAGALEGTTGADRKLAESLGLKGCAGSE